MVKTPTNYIRHVVSDHRKRFIDDNFDLDLSYITPNLIVMSYPSTGIFERYYRNRLTTVRNFLELRHQNDFKIYNFCSERSYDPMYFGGIDHVVHYPFPDHFPPPFNQILKFINDISNFLNQNDQNVAVLHCKAGKGRSGTMCCAFLISLGFSCNDALLYFTQQRTTNHGRGVTISSQIRYVGYFAHYHHNRNAQMIEYKLQKASILSLCIYLSSKNHTIHTKFRIKLYTHENTKVPFHKFYPKSNHGLNIIQFESENILVESPNPDIRVHLYHRSIAISEPIGHFWINTFFEFKQSPYGPGHTILSDKNEKIYTFSISGTDLDSYNPSWGIEKVEIKWKEVE